MIAEPNVTQERWNPMIQLEAPLTWRTPKMVELTCDLFDAVEHAKIDQVFALMAITPHSTFRVLTKSPNAMHKYLTEEYFQFGFEHVFEEIDELVDERGISSDENYDEAYKTGALRNYALGDSGEYGCELLWPIRNVHVGTIVGDQSTADQRIPSLLQCPAKTRYIEVAGPCDIRKAVYEDENKLGENGIQFVVVDATQAISNDSDWVTPIHGLCIEVGIPFILANRTKHTN